MRRSLDTINTHMCTHIPASPTHESHPRARTGRRIVGQIINSIREIVLESYTSLPKGTDAYTHAYIHTCMGVDVHVIVVGDEAAPPNRPVSATHPPINTAQHHTRHPRPVIPRRRRRRAGRPREREPRSVRRRVASHAFMRPLHHPVVALAPFHRKTSTNSCRLAEEERYLKMTAREIRRLCMLTLAFIRQARWL